MSPGDLVGAALAVAVGVGVIAWLADRVWGRPRCERCGVPAVPCDADVPSPHVLVAVVEYRCPSCHRVVNRRYLALGD